MRAHLEPAEHAPHEAARDHRAEDAELIVEVRARVQDRVGVRLRVSVGSPREPSETQPKRDRSGKGHDAVREGGSGSRRGTIKALNRSQEREIDGCMHAPSRTRCGHEGSSLH